GSDVSGQGGGGRRQAVALRPSDAPLHAGPAGIRSGYASVAPQTRKRQSATPGGRYPDGSGTTAGMPVPHPLPARDAGVPDRGTGDAGGGSGTRSGVSSAGGVNR